MKSLVIAVQLMLLLSGCKTTEPQYYYGEYNKAVYSYFKADESRLEEQITRLQTIIEKAAASGKPVAPGIHAHLGMLYFETGNPDRGTAHFEQEKALFPESAQYIEFLIKSGKEA